MDWFAKTFATALVAGPMMFIEIWAYNVVARAMNEWGWLDVSWLTCR